eukprot:4815990-Amphidinium_carterae.1
MSDQAESIEQAGVMQRIWYDRVSLRSYLGGTPKGKENPPSDQRQQTEGADSDWAGCKFVQYNEEKQKWINHLALVSSTTSHQQNSIDSCSSGKAVASKLGLNRKSKHVQLKFLYVQDVNQKDPNCTQSSRCAHEAPTSCYNAITP